MNTSVTTLTHSSVTSFSQLFGRKFTGHVIKEIEIPLIQRDYAQGRNTENVNRIRETFINALCNALLPDTQPIDLDFVFGDVEDKEGDAQGKFYPLDGQQRLTTLFLLHCYLAWKMELRPHDYSWSKFSYATRPGARDFCNFLTMCNPDFSERLSAWIKDHAEYLPTWQHDPSIQSMLVVLDAINDWFVNKQTDLGTAWSKLVDENHPAIRFHILPMKANGLTDELYIKMNSRGKPLTQFENFKAHFEDVLKKAHSDKANDFAKKVDTDWSNILWPYRGDDNLIDDEFMHYFRFIAEVCAWKNGIDFNDNVRDDDLFERVYGAGAPNTVVNLSFLFAAFDVWNGKDVKNVFKRIWTASVDSESTSLLMFKPFEKEGVDLFNACCEHYGISRQWTLADTLLLYGVLLKFINQVPENDFSKRLRILRNLVEASEDEIRAGERNNMPKLLIDVEQIIVHGNLQQIGTFNQVQVRNEEVKEDMLQAVPALKADLYRLEDHELLRGGLTVFDFNPEKFAQRAQAFIKIFNKSNDSSSMPWKLITGALLAQGDYSRLENRWTNHRFADFGSSKNNEPWQTLFRGKKGESTHPTSMSLMKLLDAFNAGSTLRDEVDSYLNNPNTVKDWRYYFVKYDAMREGASGRYTINPSGYRVCMLNKERMSSNYYDPFLFAAVRESQISLDRITNPGWPRCFYGYETEKRALTLTISGLKIECVDNGWQISEEPTDVTLNTAFNQICKNLNIKEDLLYLAPQTNGIDTDDRITMCALFLQECILVGL